MDALVTLPRKLILIEAKIQKFMDGLSKLPVYKSLVASTPELAGHFGYPIEMKLLMPTRVDWIIVASKRFDVEVIYEAPDYIIDAWMDRDKYWSRENIEKRNKRKKFMEEHGFD